VPAITVVSIETSYGLGGRSPRKHTDGNGMNRDTLKLFHFFIR
jgi:hypothetical protein